MRRGDSRHHTLMSYVTERAIQIQTRRTLYGHAFLAREIQNGFQPIHVRCLQNHDRLDLSFAGAQCLEHGIDAVDDVGLCWTTWISSFAIGLMWAASRHQSGD